MSDTLSEEQPKPKATGTDAPGSRRTSPSTGGGSTAPGAEERPGTSQVRDRSGSAPAVVAGSDCHEELPRGSDRSGVRHRSAEAAKRRVKRGDSHGVETVVIEYNNT